MLIENLNSFHTSETTKIESKDTRILVKEAIDRIINKKPIIIAKEAKLNFKNIAKEAQISSSTLYQEFGDVMTYVASLKKQNSQESERITVHANYARKLCLKAIERIINGKATLLPHNSKLNVLNVAKESGIADSYIFTALPDIVEKISILKTEIGQFGNADKSKKLFDALNTLQETNQKVSVKAVCRAAGFGSSFDNSIRKTYPDVHVAILNAIEKQNNNKRKEEETTLEAAIERIMSGVPINITSIYKGGRISIRQLSKESGIHESSIMRNHKEIYDKCMSIKYTSQEKIWFIKNSKSQINQGDSEFRKYNFHTLNFEWILECSQLFIRNCLITKSASTVQQNLIAIKIFDATLFTINPSCRASELSRSLMEKILYNWSKNHNISESTFKKRVSSLRQFFEWCEDSNLLSISAYKLIRNQDFPKVPKALPRFIPEKVMSQLNFHIDKLHPHIMRFLLVLQEVGMRISECCALKYDCIFNDKNNDYYIKYYQFKMKKEHIVPLSIETMNVIKEQQRAVISEFDVSVELLFPTPIYQSCGIKRYARAGKAWSKGTLLKNLNKLAIEQNICDENGKVFHFSFHQFRHTVATRMINNGVPQHIVQKYLGHETPTMTSTYAHIMDETLKSEFQKFHNTMIDINGKKFNDQDIIDDLTIGTSSEYIDAQWLKKNIAMQTLPNGLCSLPVVQGGCPHANACLTCSNFRTDHTFLPQHKEQLQRTEVVIETCRKNGWVRQLEMNERIKESLVKIITPLEDN